MLKIRMQRIGRRHDPKFRVIVTDARRGPKTGNFIEMLGSYDAKMGNIQLNADRIKYWLSVGAQASDTVHNFLVKEGVVQGKTRNALPKKSPIVSETEEAEAPAEAAPAADDASAATEEAPAEENVEEAPAEDAA